MLPRRQNGTSLLKLYVPPSLFGLGPTLRVDPGAEICWVQRKTWTRIARQRQDPTDDPGGAHGAPRSHGCACFPLPTSAAKIMETIWSSAHCTRYFKRVAAHGPFRLILRRLIPAHRRIAWPWLIQLSAFSTSLPVGPTHWLVGNAT